MQLTLANQQLTEELKLQLGDRLPAAMTMAAKAMKMPMDEFTKALEDGAISAKEFMPVFSQVMKDMAAPGLNKAFGTMLVAFNRMIANGKLLVDAIFQSGVGELFTQIFNSLSDIFTVMKPILSFAGALASTILKVIIFPIRLVIAMIRDAFVLLDYWIQETFGTSLDDLMAGLGKVAGYIISIFAGVGNFLQTVFGPIISALKWLFGKGPTGRIANAAWQNTNPAMQEAVKAGVAPFVGAGKAAGRIGSQVLKSNYTTGSGIGYGAVDAGAGKMVIENKIEFRGDTRDALREVSRDRRTSAYVNNSKG